MEDVHSFAFLSHSLSTEVSLNGPWSSVEECLDERGGKKGKSHGRWPPPIPVLRQFFPFPSQNQILNLFFSMKRNLLVSIDLGKGRPFNKENKRILLIVYLKNNTVRIKFQGNDTVLKNMRKMIWSNKTAIWNQDIKRGGKKAPSLWNNK